MKTLNRRHLPLLAALLVALSLTPLAAQISTPTTDMRGLWVTKFRTMVLGDTAAENQLLEYAAGNEFNYLICTNTFQILTDDCSDFTSEMEDLRSFIEKAHTVYNISYISANVGSASTAEKVQTYNNCGTVSAEQRFDMITYECEFYNDGTNGSCPDFASYHTSLQAIRAVADSTVGSDPTKNLIFEVYIGGSGSTGGVLTTSSLSEMQTIASLADQILLTYYRSTPYNSSGNFFNWTIGRLEWLAGTSANPTPIVLLLKSRDTDGNNMFNYLLNYAGSHVDAIRAPWHAWVEGTAWDAGLAPGYLENYGDGTYPWLEGIHVTGFAWFEHLANIEIADTLASSVALTAEPPEEGLIVVDHDGAILLTTPDGSPLTGSVTIVDARGVEVLRTEETRIAADILPSGFYVVHVAGRRALFVHKR